MIWDSPRETCGSRRTRKEGWIGRRRCKSGSVVTSFYKDSTLSSFGSLQLHDGMSSGAAMVLDLFLRTLYAPASMNQEFGAFTLFGFRLFGI